MSTLELADTCVVDWLLTVERTIVPTASGIGSNAAPPAAYAAPVAVVIVKVPDVPAVAWVASMPMTPIFVPLPCTYRHSSVGLAVPLWLIDVFVAVAMP